MLLEREAALERLRADLASAAKGAGRTVLVGGEAGIGKTTLVEAFTAASGARVLWGACEALSTPHPLGPLHDVARTGAPRLVPHLREGADRARLFEAVLQEAGREPPTVLVLEDVHWADAATLDLVRFLGRRIASVPALLLLTYRDDELDPGHGLRAVLGGLPARHVTRLPLPALSAPAVARLAGEGRDAAALHAVSGGNPFFVTELLAHAAEEVPATVRDAVLGRAAGLDPGARELLDLAASVPRAIEIALCEAVLGAPEAAIAACLASGLLRSDGHMLRFRHELARVAVEEAVAPHLALRMHRRILEALPRLPGESIGLARQVHHAQRAGDAAAVLRLAPLAAREAALRGARREAAAHCRAALQHADALDPLEHAALLDTFATHAFECNDLAGAIGARERALALVAGRDPAAECDLWARHAMPLVRALRNADADHASRRAMALAEGRLPDAHRGRAFATESYLRMLNRDLDEAIARGQCAVSLAERAGDADTLAAALTSTGAAMLFVDYARGRELLARALDVARRLDDGGVRVTDAYLMLGTAAGEVWELEEARSLLAEGLAFAHARDLDRLAGYMEAWQALVMLRQGDWPAAGGLANALLARQTIGSTNRVMALVALGRLRVRRGDPGIEAVLGEALALAERSGTLQRVAPVRALRAEAAWLAGDGAAAIAEASAPLELACVKRHAWFIGELAFVLWRAGALAEPPPGCAEPFALQIRGDWQAAARAWEQRGCPYERACALADGDAAAQGIALGILDRLEARPMAAWLRRRMKEAGAAVVPRGARPSTRANPSGLTAREMEVLRLVARGWQNARIARQLSRSPRTVEHHLEAILAKLAVGTRGEAVAVALERGLLGQDG